jgi:hypothetical protein
MYPSGNGICSGCPQGSYGLGDGLLCTECASGKFSNAVGSATANTCTDCSAGKYSANGSHSCTNCDAGKFSDIGASMCTVCPVGTFGLVGQGEECINCPLGTYADTVSTPNNCSLCPRGFYADGLGFAKCTKCRNDWLTTEFGATSGDDCANPTISFIAGSVSLLVLIPLAFEYLVNGRFSRVAFLRQQRVGNRLIKSVRKMMSTMYYLTVKGEAEVLYNYNLSFSRFTITWVFFVSAIILFLVIAAIGFALGIIQVYFRSMVVWRGLSLTTDYKEIASFSVYEMIYGFLPENEIGTFISKYLDFGMKHIMWVLEYMSSIKIDLTTLIITCKGASAPFELMVFLFILGLFIVLIESNYQLFRAVTFMSFTEKFTQLLSLPSYKSWAYRQNGTAPYKTSFGLCSYLTNYVVLIFARTLGSIDFFAPVLLYTMSLVKIYRFADTNYMHEYTLECNLFAGYEDFDYYLALVSSLIAWVFLVPALYEISKILIPGIPKHLHSLEEHEARKLLTPKKSVFHVVKYFSYCAPDLYMALFANMWINNVKKNTPCSLSRNARSIAEEDEKLLTFAHEKSHANMGAIEDAQDSDDEDESVTVGSAGALVNSGSKNSPSKKLITPNDKYKLDDPDNYEVDDRGHHHRRGTVMYRNPQVEQELAFEAPDHVYDHPSFRIISSGTHAAATAVEGIYISEPGSTVRMWRPCAGLEVVDDAYYLIRINRETRCIDFAQSYDVKAYGKDTQGRKIEHLVEDLDASRPTHIVVVFTTGEPAENRLNEGLPDALYRCGASPKIFAGSKFVKHSAYMLVGIPTCGQSNGFELNQGGIKHSVIDVTFDVTPDGWKMDEVHVDEVQDYCLLSNQSYLLSTLQQRSHRESFRWKRVQLLNMPSYVNLLRMEMADIETSFKCMNWGIFKVFLMLFNLIIVISGLGHLVTSVGRKAFYLVFWKVFHFVLLCMGYWTDELVRMYAITEHAKNMSIVWDHPVKKRSVLAHKMRRDEEAAVKYKYASKKLKGDKEHGLPVTNDDAWLPGIKAAAGQGQVTPSSSAKKKSRSSPNDEGSMNALPKTAGLFAGEIDVDFMEDEETDAILDSEELNRQLRNDYSSLLQIIISSRAAMMQIIPVMAVLTVFASNVAGSPMYPTKKLAEKLPVGIVGSPFKKARELQQEVCDEINLLRLSDVSIHQDSRPNPHRKKNNKGQEVEVSREERAEIERINFDSRLHLQKIIEQPPRLVDNWMIVLDGICIFFGESRNLVFLSGFIQFIVTMAIVLVPAYADGDNRDKQIRYFTATMLIILAMSAMLEALKAVLSLGKHLHITDEDILNASGLRLIFIITDACGLTTPRRAREQEEKEFIKATSPQGSASEGHTSGDIDKRDSGSDDDIMAVYEDVDDAERQMTPNPKMNIASPVSSTGSPVVAMGMSHSELDDMLDDVSLSSAAIGSVDSRSPSVGIRGVTRSIPALPTVGLQEQQQQELPRTNSSRWASVRSSISKSANSGGPSRTSSGRNVLALGAGGQGVSSRVGSRKDLLLQPANQEANTPPPEGGYGLGDHYQGEPKSSYPGRQGSDGVPTFSSPVTVAGSNPLRDRLGLNSGAGSARATNNAPLAQKPMSTIDQIRARREQSSSYQTLGTSRESPRVGTSPRMSEFLSKQRNTGGADKR